MGQRIALLCEKCGYQKEMSVGSGLISNNAEVIASCLNQKEAEDWHRLRQENKINFFRASQKVFYCEHCNNLLCQLSVDIELADGNRMILGNICGVCGKELQEIELQAHPICPLCKSGELSWKQIGLWD